MNELISMKRQINYSNSHHSSQSSKKRSKYYDACSDISYDSRSNVSIREDSPESAAILVPGVKSKCYDKIGQISRSNKPRLKSFVGYASKRNMNNLDVEVETPIAYEYIPIEYWDRSDECKEAKLTHMDRLDLFCEDRVYTILSTILWDRDINLEPNMFPYDTPKDM